LSAAARLQQLLARTLPAPVVYWAAEHRYRALEPELRHVAQLVPTGRTAVDVGAWLGPWTRALSRHAAHVHAFEPQPDLAARLRRVAGARVTVHQAAAGATPGRAQLVVDHAAGRDALAHLVDAGGSSERGASVEAVDVELVRLDDCELGDVGFLKIDAEGHEGPVLDGAEALLERCRPLVLVEVEQRHLDVPIGAVHARLLDRGWTGWFLRDGAWRPLAQFDLERDQQQWVDHLPDPRYVNNFLFRP
jgi:FkbM family methyltransferase